MIVLDLALQLACFEVCRRQLPTIGEGLILTLGARWGQLSRSNARSLEPPRARTMDTLITIQMIDSEMTKSRDKRGHRP